MNRLHCCCNFSTEFDQQQCDYMCYDDVQITSRKKEDTVVERNHDSSKK